MPDVAAVPTRHTVPDHPTARAAGRPPQAGPGPRPSVLGLIMGTIALLVLGTAKVAAATMAAAPLPTAHLTPPAKAEVEALISCFENDTPHIQYGYIEALKDGRGYTIGRAGFTTATGDWLSVVQAYTAKVPGNPLARFIPRLKTLANEDSSSITGLDGMIQAIATVAKDPAFRAAQDAEQDKDSYLPAMVHADALGLTLPLSLGALYDAEIQHGDDDDPDGLPALLERTLQKAENPASGGDEKEWLLAFLSVREADLTHASDVQSRAQWAQTADRAEAWRQLAKAGDWKLDQKIHIHTRNFSLDLPAPH